MLNSTGNTTERFTLRGDYMSMVYCQGCGKEIHESAPTCPHCGAPQHGLASGSGGVTFGQAISICFSKYAGFGGRARRSEYWYFILFYSLLTFVVRLISGIAGTPALLGLCYLVFLIPILSAASRRLHDTGHSGWWQLLYLTLIGGIVVFVWLVSEGDSSSNKYGHPV